MHWGFVPFIDFSANLLSPMTPKNFKLRVVTPQNGFSLINGPVNMLSSKIQSHQLVCWATKWFFDGYTSDHTFLSKLAFDCSRRKWWIQVFIDFGTNIWRGFQSIGVANSRNLIVDSLSCFSWPTGPFSVSIYASFSIAPYSFLNCIQRKLQYFSNFPV